MIQAHQLTKRYGDKTAVHTLSFTIAPGTVTRFLGPNWASGLPPIAWRHRLEEVGDGTSTPEVR
jgi:ABC-2 type transport system ATP-binding protein